jgi:RHH-type transcriptional regulator, rel operon repressor / antitoxin RelB
MARLSFRLDDDLFDRILEQSRSTNSTPSAYLRAIVQRFEGNDPTGYHDRFDELHATTIQALAIIAAYIASVSPAALTQGMEDARALLIDRGLLEPDAAPFEGGRP